MVELLRSTHPNYVVGGMVDHRGDLPAVRCLAACKRCASALQLISIFGVSDSQAAGHRSVIVQYLDARSRPLGMVKARFLQIIEARSPETFDFVHRRIYQNLLRGYERTWQVEIRDYRPEVKDAKIPEVVNE